MNRNDAAPNPNASDTGLEAETFLKKSDVLKRTTLSESTLERRVRAGAFPRPVRLSLNRIAWRASDVAAWMRSQTTELEP